MTAVVFLLAVSLGMNVYLYCEWGHALRICREVIAKLPDDDAGVQS